MASSSSVQFFGREKVMAAFEARGIETWGLFQSKQFINAGEGSGSLDAFLQMLEPGGSQAIYTLKVYRDIADADEITDKTECNGSFNFKLFNPMAGASLPIEGNQVRRLGAIGDPIYDKIQGVIADEVGAAIDKRLSGNRDDEATEPQSVWDMLIGAIPGYLQEPEKLVPVINAIGAIFRPATAPEPATVPMSLAGRTVQRVGAVKESTAPAVTGLPAGAVTQPAINDDEKLQRLASVLDRLEAADSDILIHLEQLADLAEKQPGKYKLALSFL